MKSLKNFIKNTKSNLDYYIGKIFIPLNLTSNLYKEIVNIINDKFPDYKFELKTFEWIDNNYDKIINADDYFNSHMFDSDDRYEFEKTYKDATFMILSKKDDNTKYSMLRFVIFKGMQHHFIDDDYFGDNKIKSKYDLIKNAIDELK